MNFSLVQTGHKETVRCILGRRLQPILHVQQGEMHQLRYLRPSLYSYKNGSDTCTNRSVPSMGILRFPVVPVDCCSSGNSSNNKNSLMVLYLGWYINSNDISLPHLGQSRGSLPKLSKNRCWNGFAGRTLYPLGSMGMSAGIVLTRCSLIFWYRTLPCNP